MERAKEHAKPKGRNATVRERVKMERISQLIIVSFLIPIIKI